MRAVHRLALYGTLRRGEPAFKRLGLASKMRFVRHCKLPGVLYDLGDYPALVPGSGVVSAELYEIRGKKILALLDAFEGFHPTRTGGSGFVRRRVRLLDGDGEAWVYLYRPGRAVRPSRSRRILSGDWRRRWVARRVRSESDDEPGGITHRRAQAASGMA